MTISEIGDFSISSEVIEKFWTKIGIGELYKFPFFRINIFGNSSLKPFEFGVKVVEFNFELFVREIKSKESLELKDYTTAPNKQEDTLIEFIGNKWVLHASTNIQAGNESFQDKKKKYYSKDVIIKIPTNDQPKIGMNSYSTFEYRSIVERSIEIATSIATRFHNSWK